MHCIQECCPEFGTVLADQLKEMQKKMDSVQEQLNCQVMTTSRSNTFGKKYSRINGHRPTDKGTDAMNYFKANVFNTEMFCYVELLE